MKEVLMKFQEISDKLTQFINRYNYLTEDRSANVLFLLTCIVLKYLADNQRIDFEAHRKDIKKHFTLDYILGLWQGKPLRLAFGEHSMADPQPIGDEIWDWVCELTTASPSLAGENPGLIGSLYEASLLINHKKNHGIFYTPENIAAYMASDVLGSFQPGDEQQDFRILDPACGSGSLLNAVYDEIVAKSSALSPVEKEAQHRQLLENCLLGVDRDPIACLVTRLILTLKGNKYVKPLGVFCGDILTEELVTAQSVDVVIGNPPYVGHKEIQTEYMKLLKNRDAGDLQPVVMRYLAAKPMIPIQLTAVAATPDMDVQLWILGSHRAIPVNYPHVEINEARLDWLNRGSNYRQVVTEAMNEAGGRGFVTDYAGDSKVIPLDQLDPARFDLESLRQLRDPIAFATAVRGFFPNNGAYVSFISRHVPKPAAYVQIEDTDFYSQLEQYADALRQAESTVNTAAAISELETTLVNPLKDIRRLFMENPYLTAMYTTLSADEMTLDPVFDFNPQLPKVAVLRQAEGVRLCSRDVFEWEAPIRITTPKGLTFMAQQNRGGDQGQQGTVLPAAARIQRTAATGAPETLTDNSSQIAAGLGSDRAVVVGPNGTVEVRPLREGFGCACAAPNSARTAEQDVAGATEGLAYMAVLLGFWGWRRRKQPRA
ncbi:MAG: hypothetical protein CVV27_17815 [Candidatus Melainabacteria bacterium HGW-Melainabacteria-1]|nr:MAG: hypothetical protein CVV27_17815 [Candidatus Melainabacteria bacterium HGW-Melainabacteria-1]